MDNKNPFREFRAEQMGKDLWKLYVPGPFEKFLSSRPLVLEGGRGSGKTMFFLCNSWNEKLKSIKSEGKSIGIFLSEKNFIGLYYKVDTAFVTSMEDHNRSDWDGVFNTYLNICILKEAIKFLKELVLEGVLNQTEILEAISVVNYFLKEDIEIMNIESALNICEMVLDDIEQFINSPSDEKLTFKLSIIGRSFSKFVEKLKKNPKLSGVKFRIFIDEYETLLEYQQSIVNTLIKHSNSEIIYNIGMRSRGMLTLKTAGSNEIIQAPHDYTSFRPETFFDPEGDTDTRTEYYKILKEICRLRLEKFKQSTGIANLPTDIDYYLGEYSIEEEIEGIIKSKKSKPFINKLKSKIFEYETDAEKANEYFKLLGLEAPPLNARLHLCLLLRASKYRPSLEELSREYLMWKNSDSKRYKDWLHNTKYGLVFLLAREYDQKKLYYGLDVFMMLSTGVIRYFLELCEQAFDFALIGDFDWNNPRKISPQEQSKAARYVSKYKVRDISGYEPNGKYLKIFVQNLGEIFKEFHRNPQLTLGEPEPNHFYTNDSAINEEAETVLNSAIMWGVLQERIPTKEKISDLPIETIDYHLNRIYCPYFEISYRKKRKIYLDKENLQGLLSGKEDLAKEAAKKVIDNKLNKSYNNSTLEQLSLFDGDE
ncbi:ORC-CDC6 family AAA ATPase [Bacillus sp. FSL K6-0067]|uniref:ORC-CDC6 family AAA ATPase n=1 Tax=Bacillus sp. FSL K6-0067 TaxID=2921412 RepID=UPI00077A79BC|nr:hypothetical protein [Bacillus cereus]KXY34996.1 hypothetical protein AT267_21830 [Bacillus cereus]